MRAARPARPHALAPAERRSRYAWGQWEPFLRTEKRVLDLVPSWQGLDSSLQRCCFGQPDTYLRIELWNNDANGFHDLLGTVETSLTDLLSLCENGPVNFALQTQNADPAAILGPTPPLKGRPKKDQGAVLRALFKLPTSNGRAAVAAAAEEAASPTRARRAAKQAAAAKGAAADPAGVASASPSASSATRRRKPAQAYAEDLAFLEGLMKVRAPPRAAPHSPCHPTRDRLTARPQEEVVEESDMKALVSDGIRFLCERVAKPSEALSSHSGPGSGKVAYRHTRRSRAQRAGKQATSVSQ